jgi:23S rRNA pseudouridine1911/1915/1917 synthase
MKTKILYEDAHLFVIHKPAGIAVQSARVGQMDCESELRNYLARFGARPYIGLVHRLDQPVEGVLVVAKTKEAAAKLNKQLAAATLNKKYLAAVYLEKETIEDEGTFTDYLLKDGQVAKIVSSNIKEAKEARLNYKILNKKGDLALVDVEIETGRFHQIRCQMSYHGMPLLGDAKYGSNTSQEISLKEGIRQAALCADRIIFKHPVTNKQLSFEVEPENKAFAKFL